jgi:hypothetical protein
MEGVLKHHDYEPSHSALSVWEFLVKHNIPLVPHQTYSLCLAPGGFSVPQRQKTVEIARDQSMTGNNIQKEERQK